MRKAAGLRSGSRTLVSYTHLLAVRRNQWNLCIRQLQRSCYDDPTHVVPMFNSISSLSPAPMSHRLWLVTKLFTIVGQPPTKSRLFLSYPLALCAFLYRFRWYGESRLQVLLFLQIRSFLLPCVWAKAWWNASWISNRTQETGTTDKTDWCWAGCSGRRKSMMRQKQMSVTEHSRIVCSGSCTCRCRSP